MRSLIQPKGSAGSHLPLLASLPAERLREVSPVKLPAINKKLERGLRSLSSEYAMGFQGLLRLNSCEFLDKLHFDSDDRSSSVSSSGSCGLHQRFPLASDSYEQELKGQVQSRSQLELILPSLPPVTFEDVAGNDYLKQLIRERSLLPLAAPGMFAKGRGKPHVWSRILLYGPPGVAKTMLAQAICHEVSGTCFWVSLSDVTSKFIGESEKLLKMLFLVAEERSPSVVVFDEMDSLVRKRSGSESETERRIKTEFMRQMDSLSSGVVVVGTTNMPWELDIAALRRFERKVLVPMPDFETRRLILQQHAGEHPLTADQLSALARLTEGYTGSDISIVCNEALLKPVKMLQTATHFKPVPSPPGADCEVFWTPCDAEESGAVRKSLAAIQHQQLLLRQPLFEDFKASVVNCKPTVSPNFVDLYTQFLAKFGHSEQREGFSHNLSYFC